MTELLLGVDIGTSSSKGALVRPDGEVVQVAVRSHAVSFPQPGHAEMDPDRLWWDEVCSICLELTEAAGGVPVAAVCVSGIGPCLVPVGADGSALRPALLYGIDTRAEREIAELTEDWGQTALLDRCGNLLSSQSIGPKLAWLRRHEPELWRRTTRWFGCSSYLVHRLTGAYVQDHHSASQSDPLYDIRERRWDDGVVAQLAGHLEMPRLLWPHEVAGEVTREAAEATGLRPGTPVSVGSIDAFSEAVSCGVRRPGDMMLMYGSTTFFLRVVDDFAGHPQLWTTAGLDRSHLLVAAGTATSGSLTGWLRDLTGGAPFGTVLAEAAAVPAGSEGLLVLPYFAGERTPVFDPRARGVFAGLTLRHTRGHLFRAVYEGIAFGVRQILELMESAVGPTETIVAVGGGTQGRLWTRIVSDVTGREQLVPAETIGASYGDALLAGIGSGIVDPDTDWTQVYEKVVPDERNAALYDELFAEYVNLYPTTAPLAHRLADIEERTHRR